MSNAIHAAANETTTSLTEDSFNNDFRKLFRGSLGFHQDPSFLLQIMTTKNIFIADISMIKV
ncbi:MAG: hypothetical protein ACI910_000623 [Oleispira sp.]|jgi:hypothetical protein